MKSVIGIDPGASQSAYVWWNGKEILAKNICDNIDVLNMLEDIDWFKKVIKDEPIIAVESMVHIPNGAGKEIIDTIFWSGQFYHAWQGEKERVPVHVVRKALGAKNDPGIRAVLIQRFGEPGTKKSPGFTYDLQGKGYHLWRAFAVAVAHWDHLAFQGREMK